MNEELNKMIQEFNDLPAYNMDDICDCFIREDNPEFIKKSDVNDIFNRCAERILEKQMVTLKLDLHNVMFENALQHCSLRDRIFYENY